MLNQVTHLKTTALIKIPLTSEVIPSTNGSEHGHEEGAAQPGHLPTSVPSLSNCGLLPAAYITLYSLLNPTKSIFSPCQYYPAASNVTKDHLITAQFDMPHHTFL